MMELLELLHQKDNGRIQFHEGRARIDLTVVDAKYYRAQGLDSAPGWPDLVKQFFYARALKAYCPEPTVNNAFVFPGQGPLKSAHMHNRDSKEMIRY